MFGLEFITDAWIVTFLYVFLRFAGMVIVSPVFAQKNLPVILRMGFCLFMSFIIMMALPPSGYASSDNLLVFAINGVKEIALGMVMGFISLVVFLAAISAGQLIDMQIGFGLSNFFNPQLGLQIASTGNFLYIIVFLLFFITGGHHMLISLMFSSFQLVGPGRVMFEPKAVEMLVLYFTWFVVLVVKVCFPVLAVIIVVEFALGLVIKSMPQMNMFVVGIPLKIVLGLFVMLISLSAIIFTMEGAFDQMFAWQQKIVQGLVGG